MIEIERKFLVQNTDAIAQATSQYKIVQGYLNDDPERTVRVRIKGNQGFITIKGKSNASGTSRMEWEKEISVAEAEALLTLCKSGVIAKTRHIIPIGEHSYELDVFYGENEGLIMAEIELTSENEKFVKPNWLGEEVTGDIRYYNAYLSKHPFTQWK